MSERWILSLSLHSHGSQVTFGAAPAAHAFSAASRGKGWPKSVNHIIDAKRRFSLSSSEAASDMSSGPFSVKIPIQAPSSAAAARGARIGTVMRVSDAAIRRAVDARCALRMVYLLLSPIDRRAGG